MPSFRKRCYILGILSLRRVLQQIQQRHRRLHVGLHQSPLEKFNNSSDWQTITGDLFPTLPQSPSHYTGLLNETPPSTGQNTSFNWTIECQEAFDHLRHRLTTAPVLALPDYSKPFILDTDASDTGIGAVLSQLVDDGRGCVIAYGSRLLTKAERRYCVTRRELLVFTSHFRTHLLNRHFKLRTDHGSLTWLCNFKDPEGQLARWLEIKSQSPGARSCDSGK